VITTDAAGKAVDGGAAPGTGTVTHTGALTSGQIIKGNGAADITVGNLAGDVTTSGSMTTVLANIPNDTPMAGDLLATAVAAPATPATGKGRIYVDSTAKNIAVKDDAGVVKHGVQSKSAVASNFLTAISDAGVVTAAQPTDADLSLSAITTNDVSTTKHGFAPTLPNDANKFLNGTGGYTVPSGSAGAGSFFGIKSFSAPPSAGWSWDNQGASTIDSSSGYEYLIAASPGAADQLRVRYRTAPATPYTIKAFFFHGNTGISNAGYFLGFRDSGGKYVILTFNWNSGTVQVAYQKWTSATAVSANYTSSTTGNTTIFTRQPAYVEISDDGTNIIGRFSIDGGNHVIQFDSRLRGDFLTTGPNAYAWGTYVNGNVQHVALVSLVEA